MLYCLYQTICESFKVILNHLKNIISDAPGESRYDDGDYISGGAGVLFDDVFPSSSMGFHFLASIRTLKGNVSANTFFFLSSVYRYITQTNNEKCAYMTRGLVLYLK